MYLADKGIIRNLEKINFECRIGDQPFRPEVQIRSCSVDLRLDTVFWRVRKKVGRTRRLQKRNIVDLRNHTLHEAAPRYHWERLVLQPGETYVLWPGDSLMGRTYECYSIPVGFAGKLSGRNSYSRMGLSVHCGGDFMNPGWRGHQPLQLVNFSKLPIRVTPLLPVVQLSFVKLTEYSDRVYGGPEDKYMLDDGGPSYWWRDEIVKELAQSYGEDNVPDSVRRRLNLAIRSEAFTPDQLYRFKNYFDRRALYEISSADDLLVNFSAEEEKRQNMRTWIRRITCGGAGVLIGGSIGAIIQHPYTFWHWIIWVATLVFALAAFREILLPKADYFDTFALQRTRSRVKMSDDNTGDLENS
ncbi:hypothetical protein [Amycolatopsis sp. NPDC051716]|uniref:dCTP deaminase n=1 Tax=Amycolatopsis sp. NPDC051716 TaxID=3155804 RepID=UPI00342D02EA